PVQRRSRLRGGEGRPLALADGSPDPQLDGLEAGRGSLVHLGRVGGWGRAGCAAGRRARGAWPADDALEPRLAPGDDLRPITGCAPRPRETGDVPSCPARRRGRQEPHQRLNAARGTEYRNDIIDITLCVGVTSDPLLSVRRATSLIRAAACRNRRPGGDRPLCREPAGRSWSRSRRPRSGGDLATRPLERRDLPSGSPLERGAG